MRTVDRLAQELSAFSDTDASDSRFDIQPIPGDIEVLHITVHGREELPVFVSIADTQLLCITHLWHESEIVPEKRLEMLETMLEMNIPMPLSSFARIGEQYVLFGAMAVSSPIDDIVLELETLSDNAIDVIRVMADYLK